MKKTLSLTLALALSLSLLTVPAGAAEGGTAYASTQAVLVDGSTVTFQAYALKDANGNDTNYVKLRDIGRVIDFNVAWQDGIVIDTWNIYSDAD